MRAVMELSVFLRYGHGRSRVSVKGLVIEINAITFLFLLCPVRLCYNNQVYGNGRSTKSSTTSTIIAIPKKTRLNTQTVVYFCRHKREFSILET